MHLLGCSTCQALCMCYDVSPHVPSLLREPDSRFYVDNEGTEALYLPRVPAQGQSSGSFGWALRMARDRGTQLTSSEGGLNEKENIGGTQGKPTAWAAGRAGWLRQRQEPGSNPPTPRVAPGAAVPASPPVGLFLPASLLFSVRCQLPGVLLPLHTCSAHQPLLLTDVAVLPPRLSPPSRSPFRPPLLAACPTHFLFPNSRSTGQVPCPCLLPGWLPFGQAWFGRRW